MDPSVPSVSQNERARPLCISVSNQISDLISHMEYCCVEQLFTYKSSMEFYLDFIFFFAIISSYCTGSN